MNPEMKAKWVEALRSGEYKQGKGALRREGMFCCLGVLCDLHSKETRTSWEGPSDESKADSYLDEVSLLPKIVKSWAGIESPTELVVNYERMGFKTKESLWRLNDGPVDTPSLSFDKIAAFIETHI